MMLRILMTLSLLVAGAIPVLAGSEMDPWKALQRGEFEAAQAKWLPLAQRGEVAAQLFLGHMEAMRDHHGEAARWYGLAAAKGDTVAQTLLATLYLKGRGLKRDPIKAYAWYDVAAAHGHANAARARDAAGQQMSSNQVETARKLALDWRSKGTPEAN